MKGKNWKHYTVFRKIRHADSYVDSTTSNDSRDPQTS